MEETLLKLHLGCGPRHLNGYVNIDKYHPSADRVMDASKLDYSDNSVDEIFTSHMVEHMRFPDFLKALQEWKRVLKENGTLIIRCPNFEKHLLDWLNADYNKRWGENNKGINNIIGFQGKGSGYINRNLFSVKRLKSLVKQEGFEVLEAHTYSTRNKTIPDGDILLRAKKPELSQFDKNWQEALKDRKRFSLKWYKNHPITKNLLSNDIWQGKIVDLGCGIGSRAFLAQKKYRKVKIAGIDASQYAIDYAKKHFESPRLEFVCANLLNTPFKDNYFDNAYMLAVIEHILDINSLLKEMERILKSSSKLFLSTTEKDYHSDPSHIHIFTKDSLQEILESNNFKVLQIYVKEHIIFALAKVI